MKKSLILKNRAEKAQKKWEKVARETDRANREARAERDEAWEVVEEARAAYEVFANTWWDAEKVVALAAVKKANIQWKEKWDKCEEVYQKFRKELWSAHVAAQMAAFGAWNEEEKEKALDNESKKRKKSS